MKVESSNFNPIDIAISGIRGQDKRLHDISSNIAGIGTGGGSSGSSGAAAALGSGSGSGTGGVTLDDLPQQMINMNSAARTYQANVAVLKRYERMIDTTLELLR